MQKIIFIGGFILWCMALQAQNPGGIFTTVGNCDGSVTLDINGDACGNCELRLFKDRDPTSDPDSPDEVQSVTNGSQAVFNGLCPGTYYLVLYNADFDCYYYYDEPAVIEECALAITGLSKTDENCEDDGSITVSINDDASPYIYELFIGFFPRESITSDEQSHTFENLPPGPYTVRVRNAGSCSVSQSTTILANENPLKIDQTVTYGSRCFANEGRATVYVSGGNGNYSYSWSSLNGSQGLSSGSSIHTITGLAPGAYTVTVSSGGCSATSEFTINQIGTCDPPPDDDDDCVITIGFATQRGCFSENPVSPGASYVTVQESGNYFYEWEDGSTESFIIAYAEGTYCLTVTDADDPTCKATDCVYIGEDPGCKGNKPSQNNYETESDQIISGLKEFSINLSINPNPFNNELLIELNSPSFQSATLEVININGKRIHQVQLGLVKGVNVKALETTQWSSGIYQIIVRDAEGKVEVGKVVKMD